MSCPPIRFAFVALALACASAGAQEEIQAATDKKMPSFKITMPGRIEVPVESGPPIAAEVPLLKNKKGEFFGGNADLKTISLSDALQMALRNNLDAKVEEVGILVEDARLRNAYGEFDPIFSFSASRSWTQTPDARNNVSSADAVAQLTAIQAQIDAINANTLANQQFTNAILQALGRPPQTFDTPPVTTDLTSAGTIIFDQDLDRAEVSIQARSPIGTVIRAGVRTTRLRSTFDGDTRVITPIYTAAATVEGRQPLLKDFGLDANLADVRIARKNKQAQDYVWRFRLESTLASVVATYYDMLLGIADLENKGDAIAAGIRLVANSERRRDLGFYSPYEVQQAQVQLSFDRENLLLSKNFYLNRQYEMQGLILPEYRDGRMLVYLPAKLPSLKIPRLDRDALLTVAFQNRYDYKAALVGAETEDVRVKFAKNQRWPQLDIVASYGATGLDFDGYQSAINQLTHNQAPQWQIGIQGSFPIGGIQPRAQLDAAKARKQQALLRVQKTQLDIGVAVERAIELIRTNKERLNVAQFTTKTAEEAVKVGYRRMEEGQVSNFDLIEQQRRLYDARTRELSAQAELNKSIAQLWLSTGTVLENLGISFQDGEKLPPAPKTKIEPDSGKSTVAPVEKKKGR
jgi:outer membrane protein TolC